mgnify:CR=1 FL=1
MIVSRPKALRLLDLERRRIDQRALQPERLREVMPRHDAGRPADVEQRLAVRHAR